ncbi:MAG: hypothetical protein DSZ27_03400 [Thiomicrospira sp.]|nr:MAG: hypothetical protein DSZ27_03400 [Thiomicrospira sp.]
MPSTPLNLLVSAAHAAFHASEQKSQLVFIDQKNIQENVYFNALKCWQSSPFEQVALTSGSARGKHKLTERKANFVKLADLIESFPADAIAVGNDRRVEFQYLMHLRGIASSEVEGWYLDDGLYSYSGRPYKWFKDAVNSVLKKISYGFWWQEPKTVGASKWIKQAWLFSPDKAIRELQKKQMHAINSKWFEIPSIRLFSGQVLANFGLNEYEQNNLKFVDLFLLIPHPNNIKKMDGYEYRVNAFLAQAKKSRLNVAIKYHPRSKGKDDLNLSERYDAHILPKDMAFEFILPLIDSNAIIVGDVSTVLLSVKWLRPDLEAVAVLVEHDEFAQNFKEILDGFGILILNNFTSVYERFYKQ